MSVAAPINFVAMLLTACVASNVSATALVSGKATDESVCDLSPATTDVLASHRFISADAALDKVAIGYRRLASEFVAGHCVQGQTLILSSRYATQLDGLYLDELAIDLCTAANVTRTEISMIEPFTNDKLTGYELRCRISKFDKFSKDLQTEQANESTGSLISRLNSKPSSTEMGTRQQEATGAKQDCGKLSMSSVTVGGGCR